LHRHSGSERNVVPPPVLLAVNAGSSNVKCALFSYTARPTSLERGVLEGTGAGCVPALLAWVDLHAERSAIAAVGHRIVHGGPRYSEPQTISRRVRDELGELVPFAPNHLPHEIAIIDALADHVPAVPQVACFDTAFHQRMPEVARRLAIPAAYDRRGVRRYGFHGLSYTFLMEELSRLVGSDALRRRIVLAHLGNGSSLAAIRDGVSVDTTMAFTPIGGVVMSTRSGDLDPGVVTYIGRTEAASADQLEEILSKHSGLLGLSGTTSDMQQLLARQRDDAAARLAVEAYVYSVVKAIGGFAAVLGGLDTLVFSGGIGEHATVIRARICDALTFLGVSLDSSANESHAGVISRDGSRVAVRVIPTNEELMIARATYRVVAADGIP
jgi:acetate kinase